MRSWLYIIILCVSPLYTIAQQALPDSSAQNSATQIEVEPEENPFGMLEMFSGNPGKAALYSLIFPGAGQYYNTKSEQWAIQGKKRRLWKVPVVWAAEGTAIGILIFNQSRYNFWREGHLLVASEMQLDFMGISDVSTLRAQRDVWEQNRDFAIIGLIAVHILQATEAFISRHLIEFDVSDDLSFEFSPISPMLGFNLAVNF